MFPKTARLRHQQGYQIARGMFLRPALAQCAINLIREVANAFLSYPLLTKPLNHTARNGRNDIESTQQPALQPQNHPLQQIALEQTHPERNVNLKILNMQPSLCSAKPCR